MYYPQQPPPGYPPPQYGPRYSGCLKFILYGLSFLIPLVGIIAGIVFMSKGDLESNRLGKTCLIISIVVIILGCCIGGTIGVLPVFVEILEGGY